MGCSIKYQNILVCFWVMNSLLGCVQKTPCTSRIESWDVYELSNGKLSYTNTIIDTVCFDSLRVYEPPVDFKRINSELEKSSRFSINGTYFETSAIDEFEIGGENVPVYYITLADTSLEIVYPYKLLYTSLYGVVGKYSGGSKYYIINKIEFNGVVIDFELLPKTLLIPPLKSE
jgi:hypothetical protein